MSEHREELRKKVEARRAELQQAFKQAQKMGPDARRNGIEAELRVVDEAVKGGWEQVSEAGAVELTNWLEQTQALIQTHAADATKNAADTIKNATDTTKKMKTVAAPPSVSPPPVPSAK